jgi:hypothetical protein
VGFVNLRDYPFYSPWANRLIPGKTFPESRLIFHLTQSLRFGQRLFCLPKIPIRIDTLFVSLFLTAPAAQFRLVLRTPGAAPLGVRGSNPCTATNYFNNLDKKTLSPECHEEPINDKIE